MKKRRILSLLVVFSMLAVMVGIFNIEPAYAASKTHLRKTTVTIIAGNKYQQKLINSKGKAIKATKVKWKSKNTAVAKINKYGKITAVKAGTVKMTAKYSGKTYTFTVKVKSKVRARLDRIYKYVKNNGYAVDSDYLIPGNKCIEYANGNDVFVISINTKKPSMIYFALFRTKPAPTKYKDTTETTLLTYNLNNTKKGSVEFFQVYYTNSSVTSWSHFTSQGTINYAKYTGSDYSNEKGITNITIGDGRNPVSVGSYDSKNLVDGVKAMTKGVDKLLNRELGLRLRSIGFSKL